MVGGFVWNGSKHIRIGQGNVRKKITIYPLVCLNKYQNKASLS